MEAEPKFVLRRCKRTNARETRKRIVENEQYTCSVPGCAEKRKGLSRYCRAHRIKEMEQCHPSLCYPSREEWKRIRAECEAMLAWAGETYGHDRVNAWLSAAARLLTVPHSMVIPPRKVEPKYTQRTKASIIYAWAIHKRKLLTAMDCLKLLLAADLHVSRVDDQSPKSVRDRFRNKIVGSRITKSANISEDRETYHRRAEQMPDWVIGDDGKRGPIRWHEEFVTTHDHWEPKPAAQVMLGKMIAEVAKKEGLLTLVKEYQKHLRKEKFKSNKVKEEINA